MNAGEVLDRLGSSTSGISNEQASDRLKEIGPNELPERNKASPLLLLLSQFKDPLVIVLLFAVAISITVGTVRGAEEEFVDVAVILLIVLLNSLLGFWQEYKAERTLDSLKELAAPKATVLRGGKERNVRSSELVPGDIMIISTGDKVSADGRLIESIGLRMNESVLTGESAPVEKNADSVLDKGSYIGDRENMVFSGSTAVFGRARAVVVLTGPRTALGNIAGMVDIRDEKAPLQIKLERLSLQLGIGVMGIVLLVLAVGLYRGVDLLEMFLTAVSLAVAAIPEGLPAIVTISLALGLQRMAKKNAIVRRLQAVESLGSATVICTDKTGTLTRGEMNIREIVLARTSIAVTGEGFQPNGDLLQDGKRISADTVPELRWLIKAGVLCNDSSIAEERGRWSVNGDPTEGTFLILARKAGYDIDRVRSALPRSFEIPFDHDSKRMTTVNGSGSERFEFTKGAMETVLPLCTNVLIEDQLIDLDDDARDRLMVKSEEMAGRALRVLALAMRPLGNEPENDRLESGLTFLGMVGMLDSPRTEAIDAIRACHRAGIRVIMITGDNPLTASAIAAEMGIGNDREVMTGVELKAIPMDELSIKVRITNVYARVSPEDKVKIVEALKANGEVVAMTGDGVNDAPALKKADIGVAMGISGTDVAKESSDIVLADDNFASIVSAVEEGRGIYENIRKFVTFLLAANTGEVAVMLFASLLFIEPELLPFLLPVQILWINLITDGLPALTLGLEPTSADIMERCPRDPKEPPVGRAMALRILFIGAVIAFGTLMSFIMVRSLDGGVEQARTAAFCTLVLLQLTFVFSARSERVSLRRLGIRTNTSLLFAVLLSVLLQLSVIYLPFLNGPFRTVPLSIEDWAIVLPLSMLGLIANEVWKAVGRLGREQDACMLEEGGTG